MPLCLHVEHGPTYSTVHLSGDPSLEEFIETIEKLGRATASWPHLRGLFDMRKISSLRGLVEHVAIGKAVAQHLGHMSQIASIVPVDRVTGISRGEAQRRGANLVVFVDEREAVAWLNAESN